MNAYFKALESYCVEHTSLPAAVLYELERETHLKTLAPQMMSGRLQGQLLALFSRLMQPKMILEIGTFTGYAAICLAQGLSANGVLHTIEPNRELAYIIRKYLAKADLEDKVQLHLGRAEDIIPSLPRGIDLVFIDAGKQQNALFYDLVFDKVRSGGLILIDNVLWSGKVLESANDADTQLIRAFNKKVLQDDRVETLMLPLRDGLLIAIKK